MLYNYINPINILINDINRFNSFICERLLEQNFKCMQNKATISNKDKYKGNPRRITKTQLDLLKNHIEHLGDLSGVIYCHNNKAFVGGNQRSEIFNGSKIDIVEKFKEPTKNKTVAHGFINYNGEKYAYREVMFTEQEFRQACIVANNDGGTFDYDMLANEWDEEELHEWGFDIPDKPFAKAHDFNNGEYNEDNFPYPVTIIIDEKDWLRWCEIKAELKETNDKRAFFKIIDQV